MKTIDQKEFEWKEFLDEMSHLQLLSHSPQCSSDLLEDFRKLMRKSSEFIWESCKTKNTSPVTDALIDLYSGIHGEAEMIYGFIPEISICDEGTRTVLEGCCLITESMRMMIEKRVALRYQIFDKLGLLDWHVKNMCNQIHETRRVFENSKRLNGKSAGSSLKKRIKLLEQKVQLSPSFSMITKSEWIRIGLGSKPKIADLEYICFESGVHKETRAGMSIFWKENCSKYNAFNFYDARQADGITLPNTREKVSFCVEYAIEILRKSMDDLRRQLNV